MEECKPCPRLPNRTPKKIPSNISVSARVLRAFEGTRGRRDSSEVPGYELEGEGYDKRTVGLPIAGEHYSYDKVSVGSALTPLAANSPYIRGRNV